MAFKALLLTTKRWPTASLFAECLCHAGGQIAAIRPRGHSLAALRGVAFQRPYRHLRRQTDLDRACRLFGPDLVIPGDDMAVAVLHERHAYCLARSDADGAALIERSLGDPSGFGDVLRKSALMALAEAEGVRTPRTRPAQNRETLAELLGDVTWPCVLKADGWSSGRGTRVVHSAKEALEAYERLLRADTLWAWTKESALEEGLAPLSHRRLFGPTRIAVQDFIPGRPVNQAAVCRDGKVLASRTFEVLEAMPNYGNATVVRVCRVPEIDQAVTRCVARLRLSGVVGFDFIHDLASGSAYLLELNPRLTSAAYIAPPGLRPIAECLLQPGAPWVEPPLDEPQRQAIALFPQELERDPASQRLVENYHPAPWREPALVMACLKQARRTALYTRAVKAARRVAG